MLGLSFVQDGRPADPSYLSGFKYSFFFFRRMSLCGTVESVSGEALATRGAQQPNLTKNFSLLELSKARFGAV